MRIVIFGLTLSSTWGNGHATLWRGLCRALIARGHEVVFFERDLPYYAGNRDLHELPGGELRIYGEWRDVERDARRRVAAADAAIVTSYCPDALAAGELIANARAALRVFYDLDTPVTLGELERGREVPYIGPRGLRDYDLVLSYTGGAALRLLRERLGARRVAPLYGSVDPQAHHRVAPVERYGADLSYLGTYAEDRQAALEELFIEPARGLPERRFLIAGAQYPVSFPWSQNIYFVRHLPASEHAAFFSSARLTLNVTRRDMAALGHCPSGRLFEAAACGTAIVTDTWEGLDGFFTPGEEILLAHTRDDVTSALRMSDAELSRIGAAARARVLRECTAAHRACELEALAQAASSVIDASAMQRAAGATA